MRNRWADEADEANAVKDGRSTEQFLLGRQHITTPCDLPETPGGARIVALAPTRPLTVSTA